MTTPRLLGISGSLRGESFSTAIVNTLAESLAPGAQLIVHSLADVPLYNQDDDTDTPPEGVRRLRAAIAEADGLVIVSPEFNYGIPGVLKNALDWASRPYGKAPLIGKPVMTITSSPATTGGVRAQAPLNETLLATQSRLVIRAQTVIGSVHEKIVDGRLVDQATLDFALAAVADLIAEAGVCEMVKRAA